MRPEDGSPSPSGQPTPSVKAADVATSIRLPSQNPSAANSTIALPADPVPGEGNQNAPGEAEGAVLVPISADARVSKHDKVVKDAKTRRLYVKRPAGYHRYQAPAYSLGHSKGAPTTTSSWNNSKVIGLGHALPQRDKKSSQTLSSSRRASVEPSGPASLGMATPGGVSGTGTPNVGAADVAVLLQQLRQVVREEVAQANVGHAQHIQEHTEELRAAVEEIAQDQQKQAEEVQEAQEAQKKELEKLTATVGAGDGEDGMKLATTDAKRHTLPEERGDAVLTAERAVEDDEKDRKLQRQMSEGGMSEGEAFPNWWTRVRYKMREPFAEFLGTAILLTFGNGVNCQVNLSTALDPGNPAGSYLSISFGWAVGVALGIWCSGGISGGILNPALTISLAIWRKFPWRKVPVYCLAQILGGVLGALCVYGVYAVPIRIVDPDQTQKTASLFTTFSASYLLPAQNRVFQFYTEFFATAVLMIVVLAIGDSRNAPPPDGLAPIVLLWVVWGLGACLGLNTAYAVNPARDLGPRIALAIVGYPRELLWTSDAVYWLRTPILATITGAIAGGLFYDLLIYEGDDSPINQPWRWPRRLVRGRRESNSTTFSDATLAP